MEHNEKRIWSYESKKGKNKSNPFNKSNTSEKMIVELQKYVLCYAGNVRRIAVQCSFD